MVGVLPVQTFMLSTDAILDEDTMQRVLSSGHSRIPVYQGNNRWRGRACLYSSALHLARWL